MPSPRFCDSALLRLLFQTQGEAVPLVRLAKISGWSLAEIPDRLRPFQEAGYPIEAWPHGGYRLMSPPDIWCAEEILARAEAPQIPGVPAWNPLLLAETTSTNDVARDVALREGKPGFLVAASRQTKGRGRNGRAWDSPNAGGLYCTLVLCPNWALRETGKLSILSSVIAADAIENLTGLRPQIKWPNDLYVADRKLGGLLIETEQKGDKLAFALVGIGLNVNQELADFAPAVRDLATSLRLLTQETYRRVDLLLALLHALNTRWQQPFAQVREAWEESSLTLGQQVSLRAASGVKIGQALGLNEQGALLLRLASGEIETISAGEMTPLPHC